MNIGLGLGVSRRSGNPNTFSRASSGTYLDEEAIVDEFGNLAVFPYWEDRLHTITNTDWPPAVDFTGI